MLDTYPLQSEISDTSNDNKHVNNDIIDLDIHIEPSQNTNDYSCSLCEYSCPYENILQDHMQNHTSENMLQKQVVDKKHENQYLSMHDNEIKLCCDDCNPNV